MGIRAFIFAILIVTTGVFAADPASFKGYRSQEEPLRQLEGRGYRFGMELELNGDQSLGRVLSWFDINNAVSRQTKQTLFMMPDSEWREYLTAERLEALPEPWRSKVVTEELGVKLHLEPGPSLVPDLAPSATPALPASTILVDTPKDMEHRGGILVPKGAAAVPPKELVVDPIVKARLAYERTVDRFFTVLEESPDIDSLMNSRWFDLNHLPPEKKAALFRAEKLMAGKMVVRRDVPEKVRDLLSRLEWLRDGTTLEFRHRKPLGSAQQMLSDLHLLADHAGIKRFLENPAEMEPSSHSFSYHLNLSRRGVDSDRLAREANRVQMARLMEAGRGEQYLTTTDTINGFDPNPATKGIFRSHEKRWEVRAHVEAPREELIRFARYLDDNGPEQLRQDWAKHRHHQAPMFEASLASMDGARGVGLYLDQEWREGPGKDALETLLKKRMAALERGGSLYEIASMLDHDVLRLWRDFGDSALGELYVMPVLRRKAERMSQFVGQGEISSNEFLRHLSDDIRALHYDGPVRICERGSCEAREIVRRALVGADEPQFLARFGGVFQDEELAQDWNRIVRRGLLGAAPERGAWALLALTGNAEPEADVLREAIKNLRPDELHRFLEQAPRGGHEGIRTAMRLYRRIPVAERKPWMSEAMKGLVKRLPFYKEESGATLAHLLVENAHHRRTCADRFGGLANP